MALLLVFGICVIVLGVLRWRYPHRWFGFGLTYTGMAGRPRGRYGPPTNERPPDVFLPDDHDASQRGSPAAGIALIVIGVAIVAFSMLSFADFLVR